MTANARMLWRNFHDEATLTASDAAAGFAATQTQNHRRDDAWRTTVTSTVTMSGSFTRNRVINFFGMFRHRCHGAKIRFQAYSDAAWTTPASGGDTGTVDVNKIVGGASDTAYQWGDDPYSNGGYDPLLTESPYWYWFPAPVTLQSYKITLSLHSSVYWNLTYWQVSRFWLGKYYEFAINPAYGAQLTWSESPQRTRTQGGSLPSTLGARWRRLLMNLQRLSEAERATLMDAMAYAQTSRDVVISMFPEDGTRQERDWMINGKMSSLDPFGRQVSWLEKQLAVEEL